MPFKNREERRQYAKEYYKKHKKKLLENCKKYYLGHRNEILAYHREYHVKHKKEENRRSKEWKDRWRTKAKELIGVQCIICSKFPKRIFFHEIHLQGHESDPKYVAEHSNDFVSLCMPCHVTLHIYIKHQNKFNALLERSKES